MKGIVDSPNVKIGRKAVLVEKNTMVAVLEVTPVNIDLKTKSEKDALHSFYQELLDTISYPIYLHSRQTRTDLSNYISRVEEGDGHKQLREAYIDYCRRFNRHGFVQTRHYIVIRVSAGDQTDVSEELNRRIKEVISAVSGGDLEISLVSEEDLSKFVKQAINRSPEPTREFSAVKNEGSPEYRKTAYITGYPSFISFGWPRRLLRTNGLVDLTQVIRPVKTERAAKKLRRSSEKLDAEIDAFLASGYRGVNKLEKSLDDAEWFLDLLAKQECQPLQYGTYITAHGPTREKALETFQDLKSKLRVNMVEFKQPAFRNDYAYYADSPFYPDKLDETLVTPSVSAAAGMPFGTQPFQDSHGVLYGVDTEDGVPVLLDRFSWDSHSMAVMGTLGSGKSYSAKLELLRSVLIYPDLRIIVVDPKKEYRSTIEALGGEHRRIVHGEEYSFDSQVLGFEVESRGEFENVAALVELVQQIYSSVSKNQQKTLVLVDEARNLLNDEVGRSVLNQFVLEARDINTALHLVTQNASHFTAWREGREILDHVPGKLFFRHENVSDSTVDYFDLSDREKRALLRLRSGESARYSEALLRVNDVLNTRIRIDSTSMEKQMIENQERPVEVEL